MGDKPDNYFDKIESVKKILLPATQGMNDNQIKSIICHCSYYKAGRKKVLTGKERECYDLLLTNGLKIRTVYNWFLVLNLPYHLKEKMLKGELGYYTAIKKGCLWRKMIGRKNSDEIIIEIKNLIGGLEWKNKNSTI